MKNARLLLAALVSLPVAAAPIALPPPQQPAIVPLATAPAPFSFNKGDVGLSFGLPSGGDPAIGFSYGLGPNANLEVTFGINFTFTGATDYDFAFGFGYRDYFARIGERLYPFVQPTVALSRANSAEALAVDALIGVEYFLLDRFSIAGVTGAGLQVGNIGGTGTAILRLSTETSAISGNFYF